MIIRDLRVQLSWPTHHPPPSPPSPARVGAGTAHLVPFLTAGPPRSPVAVGSTLRIRAAWPQSVSMAGMMAVGGQCRPPAHLGTNAQGRGPARPACREMFSGRTDDSAHPHPDPSTYRNGFPRWVADPIFSTNRHERVRESVSTKLSILSVCGMRDQMLQIPACGRRGPGTL